MTPAARVKYHRDFWPACCRALKWNHRDTELRRKVVLDCMRQVGGPMVTTSDARFSFDETTALFTYLAFLGDQASLDKSARWADCKEDYRAFNRAKNADWHERQTYGADGARKLQKNRFAGRKTAAGEPLESFDPEEIRKRHITTADRHRKHEAKRKGAAVAAAPVDELLPTAKRVPAPGSVIILPPPVEVLVPGEDF